MPLLVASVYCDGLCSELIELSENKEAKSAPHLLTSGKGKSKCSSWQPKEQQCHFKTICSGSIMAFHINTYIPVYKPCIY